MKDALLKQRLSLLSSFIAREQDKAQSSFGHADRGWWIPGGAVDAGETFDVAAHRECMEEAGVEKAMGVKEPGQDGG